MSCLHGAGVLISGVSVADLWRQFVNQCYSWCKTLFDVLMCGLVIYFSQVVLVQQVKALDAYKNCVTASALDAVIDKVDEKKIKILIASSVWVVFQITVSILFGIIRITYPNLTMDAVFFDSASDAVVNQTKAVVDKSQEFASEMRNYAPSPMHSISSHFSANSNA